jgi:hypothetical protein
MKDERIKYYQQIVLKLLLSDLIAKIFVRSEKTEMTRKFPSNAVWKGLFDIETTSFPKCSIDHMAIALIYRPETIVNVNSVISA